MWRVALRISRRRRPGLADCFVARTNPNAIRIYINNENAPTDLAEFNYHDCLRYRCSFVTFAESEGWAYRVPLGFEAKTTLN